MLSVKHGPFQPALEDAFTADLLALKTADPLAPVAVVTPSRRMADRLQRLVALERQAAVVNVSFHTFHSLSAEIREGAPERRVISDALFHDRLCDSLLAGGKSKDSPRGLAAAYRSSLRDLLDAGVSGPAVRDALKDYFLPAAAEDWKHLESLLDLQERYLAALEEKGLAHGSEAVRAAAARVAAGKGGLERYRAILYYGFYDLTGVQADFFAAVAGSHPAVTLYFPYLKGHPAFAFAKRFFDVQLGKAKAAALPADPSARAVGAALPALFDPSAKAAAVPAGRFRVVSASGTRDELWAVAKDILALREGPSPVAWSDIGVVARTLETYRTLLPDVFGENAIPFSMPEGAPLLRHPVAKLSLTLLSLRRREFPAAAVLDLAQSPYFRLDGTRDAAESRRLVSEWGRLLRRTGLHSGWLQWQSKVGAWTEKDLESVEDGEKRRKPIAAADTAALWDWVSGLEKALRLPAPGADWTALSAHALALLDAHFAVPDDDPGADAWQAVRRELESLKAFDAAFPAPAWDEFLDTAEERLRRAELEPGPAADGVRVLGVMDARGDSFKHLFLIGLSEGAFPRRIEEDPLLRDAVRERLQQPGGYWILPKRSGIGGLDGYGEERMLFYLTAASASGSLTCVYPRSDDDGRPKIASFYLRSLCRAAGRPLEKGEDWRVERRAFAKIEELATRAPARLSPPETAALLARRGEDPAPFLDAAGRAGGRLADSLARLPLLNAKGEPGVFDGVVGKGGRKRPDSFSATALEALTACPFQYFAARVLGLEQPEEPAERGELAPWFKGKVYHDALRRFYEALPVRGPEAAPDFKPLLSRAFAESLEGLDWKQAGLYPLLWEAQRGRMLARLEAFVEWDLEERAADRFRPRKFEAAVAATIDGVPYAGRVDRLDEGPDGYRVIDYKSRGTQDLRNGVKRMRRLQPPLYLALVEAGGDPVAGASFYGIEDAYADDGQPAQDLSADDWAAAKERFRANLKGLVSWIDAGDFLITPDEEMYGACGFCDFDRLCRKAHPRTRGRAANSALRRDFEKLRELPLPVKGKARKKA